MRQENVEQSKTCGDGQHSFGKVTGVWRDRVTPLPQTHHSVLKIRSLKSEADRTVRMVQGKHLRFARYYLGT